MIMEANREDGTARDAPATQEPMTMDERDQVIQDLEALQLAENLSNSALARLMGCSHATWSLIKKGRYSGNVDRWLHRGRAMLRARAEHRDMPYSGFVETRLACDILKICKMAADMGEMALVIGPSGCGKTAALREFVRRRDTQAIYILAKEYARTKLALLRQIAAELGVAPSECGTIERAASAVCKKLADAYSCGIGLAKIIVVDEAQTLQPSCLNLLRNLHDDPECQAIIILSDTWRLHAEFGRFGGIAGGYEQITSRFGAIFAFGPKDLIDSKDVAALARATLEGLGSETKLSDGAIKCLTRIAQEKEKLRGVVERLRAVYKIAEDMGGVAHFTPHEIERAAQIQGQHCRLVEKAPPWARAREDQPAPATPAAAAS